MSKTLSLVLGALLALGVNVSANAEEQKAMSVIEQGKEIAFDRVKGNCLACHMIPGGQAPGNIGPPLVAMKERFPDKARIRAQIYDATAFNPNTMMPPFGKHGALSDEEIDKIVEFIYSL